MSHYLVYVPVPRYEKEWAEHHFGDPCDFPPGTNLHHVLRHFARRRPASAPPDIRHPGELSICLHGSASRKPETYNYFSPHGKVAVAEAIDDIFTMQLWEDLTDIGSRSVRLSHLLQDWMYGNGISMEGNNYENLRQKFQRIKDAYRRGAQINVSRGYKHEHK